jgi:hypothetical protein
MAQGSFETEEILKGILLELSVAARLADGAKRWHSLEEVASELDLGEELDG